MKRLLSVLTCVCIFAMSFYAVAFSDIDENLTEMVDELSSFGIINGYPDGTFRPDALITRAEFSKLIYMSIMSWFVNTDDYDSFVDVPESHWASTYIYTVKALGIVNGTSATTFKPEANITYEQVLKMIVAGLGYDKEAQSRGGWPLGYAAIADYLGITQGLEYKATDYATRGDVAKMLYNAMQVPYYIIYTTEESLEREMAESTLYETHLQLNEIYEVVDTLDEYDDTNDDFDDHDNLDDYNDDEPINNDDLELGEGDVG